MLQVRQIDCVTVKGSNQPLGLFCYDLDLEAAKVQVMQLAAQHRRDSNDSDRADAGLLSVSVRNNLAGIPDAASAARSSVVVTPGQAALAAADEEGAGVDEAELLLSQEYEDDWLDNPVVASSWGLTWQYKEDFNAAFQMYLSGDWQAARRGFEACVLSRTSASGHLVEDGPSRTLLEVMAARSYTAPPGWNGVRELTEK
eukprot:GHRR01030109.1.p1 GENE.GHRR01030109.1~~GHRR01030109.1.p1  ORF type:complete len:200 (+),score=69.83 GHRR01030109.1:78-677(+)